MALAKEKVAAANQVGLKIYLGFEERACRLVFPFEERFASGAPPMLHTILPNGVLETEKELAPKKDKGMITYAYPQTMSDPKAEELLADPINEPFIWKRDDGSWALVQTWPINFDDPFRKEFEVAEANPDANLFSDQAVTEFRRTCAAMFGPQAEAVPIFYCKRPGKNEKPVYTGKTEDLLAYLRANKDVWEELRVTDVAETSFKTQTKDKDGNVGEKEFTMQPGSDYAFYMKIGGGQEMACVSMLDAFVRDRDLMAEASSQ